MKKRILISISIFVILLISISCNSASISAIFATETPTPTATYTPTNTPTNTATPVPTNTPTPTLVPTNIPGAENAPDGWDEVHSEDIQVYVPASYLGGTELGEDYGIEEMVAIFNELLQLVAGSSDEIDMKLNLWAFDLSDLDAGTMVIYFKSDMNEPIDLEEFGNDFGQVMTLGGTTEVEHGSLTVNGIDLYKVRIFDSGPTLGHFYFFETEDEFWMGMYFSTSKNYAAIEEDFEKSLQTLSFIK